MNLPAFEVATTAPSTSNVAVLVTDDDPTSRLLICTALGGHVGEVVEAENGLEGLSRLASRTFDIAIVDLDMPVMNGFGFIEQARGRPETRDLPIIVVTGRDDVVAIERAYSLGATSFLCKPLNWSIFRYQVAYVLQGARAEKERQLVTRQSELRAFFHARASAFLHREAEMVAGQLRTMLDEAAGISKDFVDGLSSTERRLSKLLDRLRRLSSIVAAPQLLDVKAAKADELVRASLALVRRDMGEDATDRVQVNIAANRDLICAPALAVEALAQVIENALLFSPVDEPVFLKVLEAGPHRIRFEVADRGDGISDEILHENSGGHRGGGGGERLGIGLPLARNIVERHGGHFGIMSEIGRGTEVFLNFPSYVGASPVADGATAKAGGN